jgi:hypothetical protein
MFHVVLKEAWRGTDTSGICIFSNVSPFLEVSIHVEKKEQRFVINPNPKPNGSSVPET